MPLDSSNKFAVGARNANIVFLNPIPQLVTREDALNLAAWIVAIADAKADKKDGDFQKLLDDVRQG